MVNQIKPYSEPTKPRYVQTDSRYVWRDLQENVYMFLDETQNFVGSFKTEQAAYDAMQEYCDLYL